MLSTDEIELNSLSKIINAIYDMRDFLYASLIQTHHFVKWLESPESLNCQEIIIKFHTDLSQLMRSAGIKKRAHKNALPNKESNYLTNEDVEEELENKEKLLFIQALFGEKLDVDYYFPGLLQNRPQTLFHYFRDKNNQAIKIYLLENLALLEESAITWMFYRNRHISLDTLLMQSKLELTKLALSIDVATLKKNQFAVNQALIKKPIINAIRPIISKTTHPTPPPDLRRSTRYKRKQTVQTDSKITAQPSDNILLAPLNIQISLPKKTILSSSNIVLKNLDKLSTTHTLFNAIDRQGVNKLLNHMSAALSLYENLKQFTQTYYFPETLTLDKYLLNALVNSHLYSSKNNIQPCPILFDKNNRTKTNIIAQYCESVIKCIPHGLVLGENWIAGEYSSQDRMHIEVYWYEYFGLLQEHLKKYPNKQLQQLKKRLLPDNDSDEDKISERTASLSASLGDYDIKDDTTVDEIKDDDKMLPVKWIRSKSFTSIDLLSKLRRGAVFSRPLKRINTAPVGSDNEQFIQQFKSKKI